MPAKVSRRLVIDASVARAAGPEGATAPLSKHCRDALKATLEAGHSAVMTDAIREEWNRHQSGFARGWRVAMVARKRLLLEDVPRDATLRKEIAAAAASERDREAMLEDIHLVEAARAADQTVLSLDEIVRGMLAAASKPVRALSTIVWVNPGQEGEQACAWLRAGAPPEKKYQLGATRTRR